MQDRPPNGAAPRHGFERIRMIGVPAGLGAGTPGAEGGAEAIRAAGLAGQIRTLGYSFQDAGDIEVPRQTMLANGRQTRCRNIDEITAICSALASTVRETLEGCAFPLILGGDHSIGAGTVAGASSYLRQRQQNLGIIWIDAHADMNTPEVSPSGNVHGMSLAASLGLDLPGLTRLEGFAPKANPGNVALVGIRDIDRDEVENIRRLGIRVFTMRDIDVRGMYRVMDEAIDVASRQTGGFHVSLDMDALDPSLAPGTGTKVPGGLSYREAHLALEMIADCRRMISMECVEMNPRLDINGETARLAVGLIASALGKNILHETPPALTEAKRLHEI